MTDFVDIRPFQDSEVPRAVSNLLQDPQFIAAICAFKYPDSPRWLRSLLSPLTRAALKKEIGGASSVGSIQAICSRYLDRVIENSTSNLTFAGLEHLQPDKPYLFISNHRDIVMDPAFVNYALYHNGFDTVRIAIGDNLLQKPFVSDLMRLNKSFIVKRSASGVREKLQAYMELSGYIQHSISEGCAIWIAQREGRAKDGIDQTEPAIIKMLYMCQKKDGMSFGDYIRWLQIVPVTISYEYNPCDAMIARELEIRQRTGTYEKEPGEDIKSIVTGITGQKGHAHVTFGKPLAADFETPEQVATAIDEQMLRDYLLHPSNYIAVQELEGAGDGAGNPEAIEPGKLAEFRQRLEGVNADIAKIILQMYANPLLRKQGRE